MLLFRKDWVVRVNGVEYARPIDIEFEVKKSDDPEPNSASLTIYGLTDDHRKGVEQLNIYDPKKVKGAKESPTFGEGVQTRQRVAVSRAPKKGNIPVEIEAGYLGARTMVFAGFMRRGISSRDRPEVSITIEGEDGGRSFFASRVAQSFPANTTRFEVIRACASAMGVGLGNIRELSTALTERYPKGTSINGQASSALTGLLRGTGIKWSIQNGVLMFQVPGQGLDTVGALVDEAHGLIGSPRLDATGRVLVNTLMIPDMAPGAYIRLVSKDILGTFLILSVTTRGSSFSNEWGHLLECVPA